MRHPRTHRVMRALSAGLFAILLNACGGGGSDGATPPPTPPPPTPTPISAAEAFQFLNQTTFGATLSEADRVIDLGFEGWIDEQIAAPASLQLPYLQSLPVPTPIGQLQQDRVDIWYRHAVNGEDQLRQRVAFALSEILVVSQFGGLQGAAYSMADYYDTLAEHAFGNYRDLLEAVTLHPAMGVYLSMLGNQKPDTTLNIRPDENYARELMQLFTIGLVELNEDGTQVLDANMNPIPTYDQAIIEGFAHVYTGWTYANAPNFSQARRTLANQVVPMQLYPDFHDTGAKQLLGGVTLPANQSGEEDLVAALDNIFEHPNVAPFIAKQLIQRLVNSNPSGNYVARVAAVFNDNGQGVRGDLAAVVKAILLDEEARPELPMDLDGKLKEPILRVTQLWRAYEAESADGSFPLLGAYLVLGQGPQQSPSVFNFFSPSYAPPGEIQSASLVAPEMQIASEYQNTLITNYLFLQAFTYNSEQPAPNEPLPVLVIDEEMAIADDSAALIAMVANKLLGGDPSDALQTEINAMLDVIGTSDAATRVAEVIYLVSTSPEYAHQR